MPPRRLFLLQLFTAFIGALVFVVAGLLAVQARSPQRVSLLGGPDPFSVWAQSLSVLLAIPVFYLLGARTLAGRFGAVADQATLDGLTGLHNHWSFQEALQQEVRETQRYGGAFTLALINVDDFGFVDDSGGHQEGDAVLVNLAMALRTGRSVDRAFRTGGDEFAVIMPHTDLDEAVQGVERLRRTTQLRIGGTTFSVGLAVFDSASVDTDTRTDATVLRDRAETALQEAKRRGRNEVVTFTEIAESARQRTSAATITAVRHLLRSRRMGAAFQPIWNLDTHQVIGYEGLARPALGYGLAGPQDAFSGAARLGRVDELDALCRESILTRAADLPDDALLFLNVASDFFDRGGQPGQQLRREVETAGLKPHRVVIEITGNASEHMNLVAGPIQQMRSLGFHLALDDVGSGDARIGLLSKVRPDYVKVDRAVVSSARDGGDGRAVLTAIVMYAAESGAIVIAEGIETEEILHHLVGAARTISKQARFVGGQGYLLGRPDTDPPWRGATPLTWPLPTMV